MAKLKIYTASRLQHAPKWKELQILWPEFEFTARWVHEPHIGDGTRADPELAQDPEQFAQHWLHDEADVWKCDVVLVYAEPEGKIGEDLFEGEPEVLRGALVEAGMGIALDKGILLVGSSPSFGTWKYHPACKFVSTLALAREELLSIAAALGKSIL